MENVKAEQLSFFPQEGPSENHNSKVQTQTAIPKAAVGDSSTADLGQKDMAPMLKSYLEYKQTYQEHILLFQVGDFYEVFFDDAKRAAEVLSIRLTSRNKEDPNPIAMCGVPIHAMDNYIPRLLAAGLSCVLVSQVEDAKLKKGMVRREVTRIITPGVRFEGDGLDEKRFNYLAALLVGNQGSGAVAFVDVSTGWLRVQEFDSPQDAQEVIQKIRPSELLLPSLVNGQQSHKSQRWFSESRRVANEEGIKITTRQFLSVTRSACTERLQSFLPGREKAGLVEEVSALSLESLQAIGALLDYVAEVSFAEELSLAQFSVEKPSQAAFLDLASRRNLEISETRMDGTYRNSLLARLDCSRTAMGSRLLAEWILNPSTELDVIQERQEIVENLLKETEQRTKVRDCLLLVRDLDRLVCRIASNRATPRDLGLLRDSLKVLPEVKEVLETLCANLAKELLANFDTLSDVYQKLEQALVEDLPLRFNEQPVIRSEFHPEVKRLRALLSDGDSWLIELETRERAKTGIGSLKVKYNNVFGYFLEVTKTHLDKVPAYFERRQTLANAERFVLPELKEYEANVLSAKGRLIELEKEIFSELRRSVASQVARIQRSAKILAELDVFAAFAVLAEEQNYVKPVLSNSLNTRIVGGRHPVVEQIIGRHNFVPNDTTLSPERRFAVLTGPNMGGKSTYLRQVGLIQLLAQAGSFVPAESAELGLVDRIFTRIGAADDQARGDSTFMVEMREAASILRKATERSLVLIDEIGRGTATEDGLALAMAIAEWLHDVSKARTIFATHFHQLTTLPERHAASFCLSVGILEQAGEISFTHRIENRPADRSYGIEVARLAGLPEVLLARAISLLTEGAKREEIKEPLSPTLQKPESEPIKEQVSDYLQLAERIEKLPLDRLTPIQAMVELHELKELLKAKT